MFIVACSLPNMSNAVSGVQFHCMPDGTWQTECVDKSISDLFADIPGYQVIPVEKPEEPKPVRRSTSK